MNQKKFVRNHFVINQLIHENRRKTLISAYLIIPSNRLHPQNLIGYYSTKSKSYLRKTFVFSFLKTGMLFRQFPGRKPISHQRTEDRECWYDNNFFLCNLRNHSNTLVKAPWRKSYTSGMSFENRYWKKFYRKLNFYLSMKNFPKFDVGYERSMFNVCTKSFHISRC